MTPLPSTDRYHQFIINPPQEHFYANPVAIVGSSQLIIHHIDLHLLARLESGQADIRTTGAPSLSVSTVSHHLTTIHDPREMIIPKSVAQIAITARARLSLDGKIDLGQIISSELNALRSLFLRGRQRQIRSTALLLILLFYLLLQAASTVFARSPALSRLWPALRS